MSILSLCSLIHVSNSLLQDKEFLKLISSTSPEGKAQYQSWVHDSCRNIVHILEDIKSCRPPIDHICEILPRLQPRYYSISSSAKLYPTVVHVTAVLVQYETKGGRTNKGVATTYLAQKAINGTEDLPKVPVFIRKSQFRLPTKSETPVIMIGPGTGLAPFRGFIQERDLHRNEGKTVGDTILYFGCRKKAEDFIYEEVSAIVLIASTDAFVELINKFIKMPIPFQFSGINEIRSCWFSKIKNCLLP